MRVFQSQSNISSADVIFSPTRRIQSCGGDLERYKALAAEKTAKQESRDRLVAGAPLKKVAWKMRVSEPEDCENSVIKAKNSSRLAIPLNVPNSFPF